jgi:hypothetical protein
MVLFCHFEVMGQVPDEQPTKCQYKKPAIPPIITKRRMIRYFLINRSIKNQDKQELVNLQHITDRLFKRFFW